MHEIGLDLINILNTKNILTLSYSPNPKNPNDPLKIVGWGEGTQDEMCLAFLYVTGKIVCKDANQLIIPCPK